MIELESTKAKKVTIPKRVKRYAIAFFTNYNGWQNSSMFHTTPESALEEFLRNYRNQKETYYTPKYYTVYEVELEIPI